MNQVQAAQEISAEKPSPKLFKLFVLSSNNCGLCFLNRHTFSSAYLHSHCIFNLDILHCFPYLVILPPLQILLSLPHSWCFPLSLLLKVRPPHFWILIALYSCPFLSHINILLHQNSLNTDSNYCQNHWNSWKSEILCHLALLNPHQYLINNSSQQRNEYDQMIYHLRSYSH